LKEKQGRGLTVGEKSRLAEDSEIFSHESLLTPSDLKQREILRFAQNDTFETFFRNL
jgi:hypothetical protein